MPSKKQRKNIIIVSGIDGSGKTTIINALRDELARQGRPCRYVWLRYNHYLTKLLLAFCKVIGLTQYEFFDKSRVGYHNFYKSKAISWLFVWFTFVDTSFVSFFKVYLPAKVSREIIICDRWIVDILVDLEVDTRLNFSDGTFVSKLFKRLLPSDSLYLIIQREFDVVRQARDESMNDRNFPRRHSLYIRHSKDRGVVVIDNNSSLENAIRQVKEVVVQ